MILSRFFFTMFQSPLRALNICSTIIFFKVVTHSSTIHLKPRRKKCWKTNHLDVCVRASILHCNCITHIFINFHQFLSQRSVLIDDRRSSDTQFLQLMSKSYQSMGQLSNISTIQAVYAVWPKDPSLTHEYICLQSFLFWASCLFISIQNRATGEW